MFAINNDYAVDSLIIFNESNEEKTCKDNSKLRVSMILFNIMTINVTDIKIMFVESNDKDAYCVHRNSRDFSAFTNIFQLKVTQIWDIRLNKYLKY